MAKNLAGLAALGALGLLMSRKQGGSGDNAPMGVADDVSPRARTFGENPDYTPAQGPDTTGAGFETEVSPNNITYSNLKTINNSSNRLSAKPNRPSNASQPLVNYGQGRATQGPVRTTQGARLYDPTQGTAPREEPLQGVHPETVLLPGAGLKTVASLAKMFANKDKGPYFNQQALANNPTRQLSGPSKAELMARDRAARAEAKREEMLKENAANYGLDPNAPGYSAAAQSLRENIGGKDFTVKKKGGSIKAKSKPMKLASGGSTRSSASKRGDGIASKGRTRGKMY